MEYRSITLRTLTGDIRIAKFENRDHVVVPVVGLVEGVIQAMNAPHPEFVPAEAFSLAPSGWNGRPIFLNHPMSGNTPVSGNTPDLLLNSFGRVFNAGSADKRLSMEAWLDEAKAKEIGTEEANTLTRIRANKEVEISTGAFIAMDHSARGSYNGVRYQGKWEAIFPDHLAILSEGETGACSYTMGCGIRSAADGRKTVAFHNKPRSKKEETPPSAVVNMLRGMKTKVGELLGLMNPEEMSDNDTRSALAEALNQVETNFRWSGDISAVYPNQAWVIYCMYETEGPTYYRRGYSIASNGEASVSADVVEVDRVVIYPPVEEPNGEPSPLMAAMTEVIALAGARHSSKDQKMVQQLHDTSVSLGADCATVTAASGKKPCGCHEPSALEPAVW